MTVWSGLARVSGRSTTREALTFQESTERFVADPTPEPERPPRPGIDYPFPSDGRRFYQELARMRRVRLLSVLLARGRPLTFGEIRWIAERDPILCSRHLRGDLLALLDLNLVTRCSGLGHRADYAASLAAKRTLGP